MRCKKHVSDRSSSVGVCASCLRESLLSLIAAQTEAHAALSADGLDYDCGRRSDPHLPLAFPRSVSPYVSRRKYDEPSTWTGGRFFSTPQVGPVAGTPARFSWKKKKRGGRFSLFGNIFRSRSDKPETDPRFSSDPCASSSSPNWFSSVIYGRRKKPSAAAVLEPEPLDDYPAGSRWPCRATNRGMSPDCGEEYEASPWASGHSSEVWRTPATGRRQTGNPRNGAAGMAFCLSPLVRASPGWQWNQKGMMPPETGFSGEIRTAASFCANRSRKFADFGRSGHNR